ncbi:DNA-directed RNA polymerase I subunit RPA2-like [Physella acuta]|uniref:DNA-directed RNA polymerase I subunit RPA2-like n=1 Tax=Physella acuta TaxID=109671 RepID=UPI0027DD6338|nr:DNA-directed RNA polymerase I subunit RPA2-like [Physella acuta]
MVLGTKPSFDFGKPKEKQHVKCQDLTKAHIESYNYFLTSGLQKLVKHMDAVEFNLGEEGEAFNNLRCALSFSKVSILPPKVSTANKMSVNSKIYPSECREGGSSYMGDVQVIINYSCNGQSGTVDKIIGQVPIMVKSDACNIATLKPEALISHGEEVEEMGGYFIINGNEKVVRLLIQQRRNYPLCLHRSSWKNRGPEYTKFGVSIRCVREDQAINSLTLHYLNNGTAKLSFGLNKEVFFVPIVLVLKGLMDVSDKFLFDELMRGREEDTFYRGCVIFMLRQVMTEGLNSQASVVSFIGKRFRVKLALPAWYTDEEVGHYLISRCICIHLNRPADKFHLLVYMTQKLFAFVNGECSAENPDNPMFHEVLGPGHLMQMVLKEKLELYLLGIKTLLIKAAKRKKKNFQINAAEVREACKHVSPITRAMEYILSTGNLISRTGLGLMQSRGFSVIADKLNFFRYVSHFRAVHRGAFFTEMRTTAVRKLLPEAWGFLCPVHTPDGSPCGLLNHLAACCKIVNTDVETEHLDGVLTELGMSPLGSPLLWPVKDCYVVLLDGRILGHINAWSADTLVKTLRVLKVKGRGEVPRCLEICLIKKSEVSSQYPGLYLFSTVARMIRPVHNIQANAQEMVGSFEQVYLDIALNQSEIYPGVTTHQELNEQSMLSVLANLIPFSDFNQSPRNMYQCQMAKQTMGTPLHAYQHRADNKLYRIQSPQSPLVRPAAYDDYNFDEYPLGTNTVVAVISYTGYDMEDAMIINKSSYERGFAHGSIIKSEEVDLRTVSRDHGPRALVFGCQTDECSGKLDPDGLPPIGARLTNGDPFYSYLNVSTGEYRVVPYKSLEEATVVQIKVLGDPLGTEALNHVCFVLRIPRNPTIGDKFASRHGQKGICSMLWPTPDMPFTESGMVPDIIFNPHGFPSRMTIGMMIESMAGKAGALHGLYLDATPFTFSEHQPAIDYFGQMLTAGGYNYYGTEKLYSGVSGQEMEADIYFGLVYYQRLRHMVSDKYQVRTTGPVDQVTQQPVKGRKRAGGIRFGEMERDALIAHGTSFLLHDRLFNCSDKSKAYLCRRCMTLLSPLLVEKAEETRSRTKFCHQVVCQHCQRRDTIQPVSVPYVFRYLLAEMASVGVKVNLQVKPNI